MGRWHMNLNQTLTRMLDEYLRNAPALTRRVVEVCPYSEPPDCVLRVVILVSESNRSRRSRGHDAQWVSRAALNTCESIRQSCRRDVARVLREVQDSPSRRPRVWHLRDAVLRRH